MKGFILAAGLGTRLKPWTDFHPKALVPVKGTPMLQRVVEKMLDAGIDDITVNVHHMADQITDFINEKGWNIRISDERDTLLETGGGLLNAFRNDCYADDAILVHNADILSSADLISLLKWHREENNDVTLLVSDRESSRKLVFDEDLRLRGWHSLKTDEFKPQGFEIKAGQRELAFSGIYAVSTRVIRHMLEEGWNGRFPIMDFLLLSIENINIRGYEQADLEILDIGKQESLERVS